MGRKLQDLFYLELGLMGDRAPGTTPRLQEGPLTTSHFHSCPDSHPGCQGPTPSQGCAARSFPSSPHSACCAVTVPNCSLSWAWERLRSYGLGRGLKTEPLSLRAVSSGHEKELRKVEGGLTAKGGGG